MTRELKPITILRRARALIADPKTWIKGAFKRRKAGRDCYCAQGAIAAASGVRIRTSATLQDGPLPLGYYEAQSLLRKICSSGNWGNSIAQFNDSKATTHDVMLAAFDRAIALA